MLLHQFGADVANCLYAGSSMQVKVQFPIATKLMNIHITQTVIIVMYLWVAHVTVHKSPNYLILVRHYTNDNHDCTLMLVSMMHTIQSIYVYNISCLCNCLGITVILYNNITSQYNSMTIRKQFSQFMYQWFNTSFKVANTTCTGTIWLPTGLVFVINNVIPPPWGVY